MSKSLNSEKDFWKNPCNYHKFSRDYWSLVLKRDDLSFSFFDNKIICEIGCGPFGIIYFINKAKKKYGVDPLINFYKEIGILKPKDDVILINTAGESVEQIEDKTIDIVICYNVLDHVLNPKKVLSEINRILNNRGILYFHSNE